MQTYSHRWAPLKLHAGEGALGHLAADLASAGISRAVVVTGPTLAADEAILARLRAALGEGLVGVSPTARPHSPIPEVLRTADYLAEMGADGVVALGGGSAVVTARAAAIALAEGRDLRALATSRDASGRLHSPRLLAKKLPQFVVPTTPATAMVKAGSAVQCPETGERLALFDPKTRALSVALDPVMLASAPQKLVIESGLGVLLLSIEGLLTQACDPVSEALLLQAVRLSSGALWGDLNAPSNRADLAVAAAVAGRGTDQAGGGIAGVLAHAIGPRFHMANARVSAILLPAVLHYNAAVVPERIRLAAWAAGVEGDATALAQSLIALRDHLGLSPRLHNLGVAETDLPSIAEAGLLDWSLRSAPRRVTRADELLALLHAVY